MGIFFMELISVGNEETKYLINRFVLQELGILLGECLTCEELLGVAHWREWGWFFEFFRVSFIKESTSSPNVSFLIDSTRGSIKSPA